MVASDPHLKQVVPLSYMVVYERPPNIRAYYLYDQINPKKVSRPDRNVSGMSMHRQRNFFTLKKKFTHGNDVWGYTLSSSI